MSPETSEILAATPWASLEHAYGPATDVPGLLRGLASPDQATRDGAMYELHGNVWHQGTIYEASGPAARALLSMVEHGDAVQPERVLAYLCLLASGTGYHQRDWETGAVPAAIVEKERRAAETVAAALRDAAPMVAQRLSDTRPEVRAAAAALLGMVRDHHRSARTLLQHLPGESHASVLAQLRYGLGESMDLPGVRQALRDGLARSREERVASALALLKAEGNVADEEVASGLRLAKQEYPLMEGLEAPGLQLGEALAWLEAWGGDIGEPWP